MTRDGESVPITAIGSSRSHGPRVHVATDKSRFLIAPLRPDEIRRDLAFWEARETASWSNARVVGEVRGG